MMTKFVRGGGGACHSLNEALFDRLSAIQADGRSDLEAMGLQVIANDSVTARDFRTTHGYPPFRATDDRGPGWSDQ